MGSFETFVTINPEGKAEIYNRQYMVDFFAKHPNERFDLVIKKKRSKKQNNYYWTVLQLIADELGYMEPNKLHEVFKYQFLKSEYVNEETGEVFSYLESTTNLSRKEMNEYIEKISIYVADQFHIIVPEPNSQLEAEL